MQSRRHLIVTNLAKACSAFSSFCILSLSLWSSSLSSLRDFVWKLKRKTLNDNEVKIETSSINISCLSSAARSFSSRISIWVRCACTFIRSWNVAKSYLWNVTKCLPHWPWFLFLLLLSSFPSLYQFLSRTVIYWYPSQVEHFLRWASCFHWEAE